MSKLIVLLDDQSFEIDLQILPGHADEIAASTNGESVTVRVLATDATAALPEWTVIGDHSYEVQFNPDLKQLTSEGEIHRFEVRDLTTSSHNMRGDGRIKAPIPGVVSQVAIQLGDQVELGQNLFVLEAMKMQNQIHAPRSGEITTLNASPGRVVMLGDLLAEIS